MERLLAELQPLDDTGGYRFLGESPAAGDRVLARLDKSATEEIRLAHSRYKGKEVVDLRVFYWDAPKKQWRPTKKGSGSPWSAGPSSGRQCSRPISGCGRRAT
jgi:hypothetical protein